MRNRGLKSFRAEIVFYSLISLILTLITLGSLYMGIVAVGNLKNSIYYGKQELNNSSMPPKEGSSLNPYTGNQEEMNKNEMASGVFNSNPLKKWKQHNLFFGFIGIFSGTGLFIIYFLMFTKKFAIYLEDIADAIKEISMGNFEARVHVYSEDEFYLIADGLNKMARDIKYIMEQERKNEQMKNELITNVAHDLRTPLTSIIGYLDLVKKAGNIEEQTKEKYISVAYDKSKRLEKLIEDLFTYTKVSFGEVTLDLSEVDIVKLSEQLVEEFYPSIQEAELECELVTHVPKAVILVDGDLLARAFANLLGNAIKYGKNGKYIRMEVKEEKEEIHFSVTNYGEVIPPEDLENIFDKFFRVENSRSSETGGTGLGLAIARNIVTMHGGTIEVRSDFSGTVFQVKLKKRKRLEVKKEDETGK